jgi:hypothetical protein
MKIASQIISLKVFVVRLCSSSLFQLNKMVGHDTILPLKKHVMLSPPNLFVSENKTKLLSMNVFFAHLFSIRL